MKHLLISGKCGSGKSSTIRALVKKIAPTEVYSIEINAASPKIYEKSNLEICNGTYVIKVNNSYILICAGAPSEQQIMITDIISVTLKIFPKIEFAIVAKRSREKKDFSTAKRLGVENCIWEEKISYIDGTKEENLHENGLFIERIEYLYNTIKKEI